MTDILIYYLIGVISTYPVFFKLLSEMNYDGEMYDSSMWFNALLNAVLFPVIFLTIMRGIYNSEAIELDDDEEDDQ